MFASRIKSTHLSKITRFTTILLALTLISGCATTGNKSTRSSLDTLHTTSNVLLMPVDVELSVLTAGGELEPRADWTESAKNYMNQAFIDLQRSRNSRLISYQTPEDEDPLNTQLAEIERLHGVVGQSILLHEYIQGYKLPSKEEFNWTLGPKVQALKEENENADYALFVFVRDSYSSSGRVAMQIAAAILGVSLQGGIQVGFASLVDLNSGEIVWFNRMFSGTGDLRTQESATETVAYLLKGLPE